MTRRSLVLAAAFAAPFIGMTQADAHTGQLTVTTACADNGWVATWTARNIDPTHSMTPTTPGFTPTPIAVGASGLKVETFPASITTASISGYFTFDNGFTDPYSSTAVAPTGCVSPTTTTTTVPPTTTTVVTTTSLPPTTSSVTTSTVPVSRTTSTTHPETVTNDPQTLPATGANHTLGLVMVAGGLIGLGAWFSTFAKRREVE